MTAQLLTYDPATGERSMVDPATVGGSGAYSVKTANYQLTAADKTIRADTSAGTFAIDLDSTPAGVTTPQVWRVFLANGSGTPGAPVRYPLTFTVDGGAPVWFLRHESAWVDIAWDGTTYQFSSHYSPPASRDVMVLCATPQQTNAVVGAPADGGIFVLVAAEHPNLVADANISSVRLRFAGFSADASASLRVKLYNLSNAAYVADLDGSANEYLTITGTTRAFNEGVNLVGHTNFTPDDLDLYALHFYTTDAAHAAYLLRAELRFELA